MNSMNIGTVIRSTTVKMLEFEKEFMCNQCKKIFTVEVQILFYDSVGVYNIRLSVIVTKNHVFYLHLL